MPWSPASPSRRSAPWILEPVVTFTEVAMATAPGTFTQEASLSVAEYNLNPQGASA